METVQLIPVDPRLSAVDFRDIDLLYEKLTRALRASKNMVAKQQVLVFPEYIGLGLFLNQGGESVLEAGSIAAGLGALAKQHLGSVVWQFFKTYLDFFVGPAEQRLKRSVFQTFANEVWKIYCELFGNLAEAHRNWVVAGSILLPKIARGKSGWQLQGNRLYNQSVVFDPRGEIAGVTAKVHPTPDELGFINAGDLAAWQPVTTSWGKLAVFICADCWYPDMYSQALKFEATHYAVPAMVSPETAWSDPWNGYQPASTTPADIPAGLVGNLTEGEAWERFGLNGRLKDIRHQGGVVSQFKGSMLDLKAFGESQIIEPRKK